MAKTYHLTKKFFILLTITLVIVFLGFNILFQGIYVPKSDTGEETMFTIKKGEGVMEIATNLEEQGIIKSRWYFNFYVGFRRIVRDMKAGDYLLSPTMSVPEIAEKFYVGDTAREEILIFEGWRLEEIAEFFENKGLFSKEDFYEISGTPLSKFGEIIAFDSGYDFPGEFGFLESKPENLSLEGFLFPDTYQIYKDDGPIDIVRKMLINFDEKLTDEMREDIEAQGKTIFEIVVKASLIEREVRSLTDKKLVSGVIENRLEIDMALQIDATVVYVSGKFGQRVLIKDTQIDSPYNTYQYKGLPLGPISNPGLNSIKAAIYPTENSYLYYLSTPRGETIFSQNLKQHNAARAKYLK